MNARRIILIVAYIGLLSFAASAQNVGPATLPDAVRGSQYGQSLSYTPIITSVTWAVTGGTLPPGLTLGNGTPTVSLSSGNGVLTQAGVYTFTVTATPIQGTAASRTYTIHVLDIATAQIPTAYIGRPYSASLSGIGNAGTLGWSFANVPLPPAWLTLSNGGLLSGTPPVNSISASISVVATDPGSSPINNSATKTLSLNVVPDLVITSGSPPNTMLGNSSYSFTFTASGGVTDGSTCCDTWSISPANLDGLTISSVNSTGILSGQPVSAGTFPYTVTVTDLNGVSTSRPGVFNVLGFTTPTQLPNGTNGTPYSQTFAVAGNSGAVTFTLSGAPSLFGLTFNNGVLSGTPTSSGNTTFQVNAVDASGNSVTRAFGLTVGGGLPITPSTLPNGTVGSAYSQTLSASTGSGQFSWSLQSGTLPPPLTLNAATGAISGTPNAGGSFTFSILVRDANNATGVATYTVVIANPFTVTTTTLPSATVGTPYTATLAASGGTQPYSNWLVVSPAVLPAGLSLNAGTGVISGTPTTAGTATFTVQVQDSSVPAKTSTSTTLSIAVSPVGGPLSITTTNLPAGTVNTAYTGVTLAATGGTGPYSWSIPAGTLPGGLTLNQTTGAITGTPTASGSFPLTIQVADSAVPQAKATQTFTLIVNNTVTPLSVTITPTGVQNPAQQPPINITLGSAASQAINGTLALTFVSAVGPDDPMVKFSNGSRTATFTMPAGSVTTASFGTSGVSVLTGTTAGTITITATLTGADGSNLTPVPAPTTTITIAKAVPVITKMTFNTNAAGGTFTVSATGYSTTREMKTAVYHFQAAPGTTLTQPDVTVDVSSAFAAWYGSAASNVFGTQFTVTVPFTFTGPLPIVTVTMNLTNSAGSSTVASPN